MAIHQSAEQGYTAEAITYKEGRPDYPHQVIDWLKNDLALSNNASVIDLGSGTGKFIPYLQAVTNNIVAIEPVAAMQEQLLEIFPNILIKAGTAERMPIADQSVDAVVCAQSFHWFANRRALQEISRVLKPEGKLALVWNVRDESVDWVAALSAITNPFEGDTPRYYTMQWRKLFPNDLFSDLQLTEATNDFQGTVEDVIIKRTLSVSFIAKLPQSEQDKVIHKVKELISKTICLTDKAHVIFPYVTKMFACNKIN